MIKRFTKYTFITIAIIVSISFHILPVAPVQSLDQKPILSLVAGKKYYDAGQFSRALDVFQEATQIYKARGDTLQLAQTWSLISLAYQQLGRHSEAQAAIKTSLSLLEKVQKNRESELVKAQVWNRQGRLLWAMGNAQDALDKYKAAESLYAKIEDKVGVIGSKINQAQALQTLGFYRRSYKLLTQVEQKLQALPSNSLKLTGLHNLSNILLQTGNLERSQQILEQVLNILQTTNHQRALQESIDESRILISLGNVKQAVALREKELHNQEKANKYSQEAFLHYQQAITKATFPIVKAQAYVNQLNLLLESNQNTSTRVLPVLKNIYQILQELPISRPTIYIYISLAKLVNIQVNQLLITNYQNSYQILNAAIVQAQNLNDKRVESYALGTLGNLYETTEQSKALKYTQSALFIAQEINASDIAYLWQWQMGRILRLNNKNSEAINYYNQAFNNLNQLRSDLVALAPETQFSFRKKVEPVYREFVDLLLQSSSVSKDNLIKARNIIEALQLAELDNFFRDACAQAKLVNIDNLDSHTAVIYPIILENRLEIIAKLPGTDNLRRYTNINVSASIVDETVKKLQEMLRKRSTVSKQVQNASQQVYDWLIKPCAAELETNQNRETSQIKSLVFVLDGSLQNLPMSVLYDGQKYLLERYAVAVTPSLQLLSPKPLQKQLDLLIAGATNAPSFIREGLPALETVEAELLEVSKKVKSSQILKNKEFLKENLQKQLNSESFNVVHIATHGKFSSNPEETYILDWNKRIQVKDFDSLLQAPDLTKITSVELLVLSACETAIGDKRAALGLAGVAIRAGASSTLATLWQVNDASTTEFMIQFYQQLQKPNTTKAEALRNAQLAFLNKYSDTDYNRPYHWAPFILVGNWL
jgi:CHAT domain-containing protein